MSRRAGAPLVHDAAATTLCCRLLFEISQRLLGPIFSIKSAPGTPSVMSCHRLRAAGPSVTLPWMLQLERI
jgi:hypothetical protein